MYPIDEVFADIGVLRVEKKNFGVVSYTLHEQTKRVEQYSSG